MIEFAFDNLDTNGVKVRGIDELYVRVESDFAILVDDKTMYSESSFATIELADSLAAWIALSSRSRPDFEFESWSTDEIGWVWIRRRNEHWQVGSIYQEFPGPDNLSDHELKEAIVDFVHRLIAAMKTQHKINITKFLPGLKI